MRVKLSGVSKRYKQEWILWKVEWALEPGSTWAVSGPNGSGKSTLLKLLSGHLSPSRGKRTFQMDQQDLSLSEVYKHISFTGPYIDLIEEFTLTEAIEFHSKLKPLGNGISAADLISLMGFERQKNKELRYFSSGMLQRVKLVFACCSDVQLILLDEPTSNLDQAGIDWFHQLIQRFGPNKTLVIASNVEADLVACQNRLNVMDFKRKSRK